MKEGKSPSHGKERDSRRDGTPHERLLRYMRGWHKGAGWCDAYTDEEMAYPEFSAGFEAGRLEAQKTYRWASGWYEALSKISPMK
jgi:hypothetical protein